MITLTIIGIVAAITLPSLLVNINDKAWNAQRKALYARMSQAIGEMDSISGYGDEDDIENSAEAFIVDGLSKVYRVQNVCNKNNLKACGIPSSIITLNGNTMNFPQTMSELNDTISKYSNDIASSNVSAFETVNGESIAIFYNPGCLSSSSNTKSVGRSLRIFCVNMIYDLNGLKGPNEVGKDIGIMSVFYRTNSVVVAPDPFPSDAGKGASYPKSGATGDRANDAASLCTQQGEDARLPDIEELASIAINRKLMDMTTGYYWSSSVISPGPGGGAWAIDFNDGETVKQPSESQSNVRCVKR